MKKLLLLTVMLIAGFALQAQWIEQATGFSLPSVGVDYISAVDNNILWAKGYDGSGGGQELEVFTRTNNGGTTWTAGEIPGYAGYGTSMIFALDYNTAWLPLWGPSGGGVIVKTSDGGVNWTTQSTAAFAAPDGFPNVVHFWTADEGFCMGDPNGGYFEIYRTTDGGTNWTRVPSANIANELSGEFGVVGYYCVVGDNVWFGTNKGRVYKSTDRGQNWTVTTVSNAWQTGGVYVDVDFKDANNGIAHHRGNGSGTITGEKFETHDGGTTWTAITQSGPIYTASFDWVPGLSNTCIATGSASGMSGVAFSWDGAHTWIDFDGTLGTQFLYTEWTDNAHGWAGSFTDATTPSTVGGMYKYTGLLTDILQIDPKTGGVKIYPNPSNGQFTCAIIGFENKEVTINVYNTVGQLVYTDQVKESLISFNKGIDLSHLGKGLYIAEVQCGNQVIKERLVVE